MGILIPAASLLIGGILFLSKSVETVKTVGEAATTVKKLIPRPKPGKKKKTPPAPPPAAPPPAPPTTGKKTRVTKKTEANPNE